MGTQKNRLIIFLTYAQTCFSWIFENEKVDDDSERTFGHWFRYIAEHASFKKEFHARIQRGTGGPGTLTPEKSQTYRVFRNPGPITLKHYKAVEPAFSFWR